MAGPSGGPELVSGDGKGVGEATVPFFDLHEMSALISLQSASHESLASPSRISVVQE